MTRPRSIIAATLLAGVALVAPAASHAAVGDVLAVQTAEDLVVAQPGERRISLLGWGWGG